MKTITRARARTAFLGALIALTTVFARPGVAAVVLDLPSGSRRVAEVITALDSYNLPIGPWNGEDVPTKPVEGQVSRQAFRISGGGITTLQILSPLRQQILDQGYELLLECADNDCGGFDFRFGTEVLPGPGMYVDLTDFRALSAAAPDGSEHLNLLVSRSAANGFVQIVRVTAPGATPPTRIGTDADRPNATIAPVMLPVDPAEIAEPLESVGHVILPDLTFETGSASLGEGSFASLAALANYMQAHPDRRVALVGHTDAIGSLDANIALSRKRATSVKDRLVTAQGISAGRLDAEGMGYLSPIASNLTEEGREANRRVEAVLLPQ